MADHGALLRTTYIASQRFIVFEARYENNVAVIYPRVNVGAEMRFCLATFDITISSKPGSKIDVTFA